MGKIILIPTNLIKESAVLDKDIIRYRINQSIAPATMLVYFVGILFLMGFKEHTVLIFGMWSGVLVLLLITYFFTRNRLGSRKIITYSLVKISQGIEKGRVDLKYLKYLNSFCTYTDEEVMKKRDLVFGEHRIKVAKFYKNMRELILKINHANNHEKIGELDINLINNLAINVFHENSGLLESSYLASRSYPDKENFLKTYDIVKTKLSGKFSLFILYELLLIFVLYLMYIFLFPEEKNLILVGFFGISGVILNNTIFKKAS